MSFMFLGSIFNRDISMWKVDPNANTTGMFIESPLDKNPHKWYRE